MAVLNFRELIAWQKAMDLSVLVYGVTKSFPREEVYGLCSQLRRAVVSIPSNIAEGQARQTTRDFLNFLSIAMGSLAEVETQILIAYRLCYLDQDTLDKIEAATAEVGRIVNGLRNSLGRQ